MKSGIDRLPETNRPVRMFALTLCLAALSAAEAQVVVVETPLGAYEVSVPHIGPDGDLMEAGDPTATPFRPPTIFSAPLPSGSGARALGVSGAFTALADDATSASWNPGGLIQLERPEVSWVLRWSRETQTHTSMDNDFRVGEDSFENFNLNYLSAVYPFHVLNRNWVISMNYQETYDFKQTFHADLSSFSSSRYRDRSSQTFTSVNQQHFEEPGDPVTFDFTAYLTTRVDTSLRQLLAQSMVTDLAFDQEGIIDAVTPAFALELTPKLTVGGAVNFYRDDSFGQQPIRSSIRAAYSGRSTSRSTTTTRRTTTGQWFAEGVAHFEPSGDIPIPIDVDFRDPENGTNPIEPFSVSRTSSRNDEILFEGDYREVNEFNDLSGINATFGALYVANRFLSLGGTVDLPWTAEARQRKQVRNSLLTWNRNHTRLLDEAFYEEVESKDVEFDFPLYWSAGAVVRCNLQWYAMLDVSRTHWSDFVFKAEGDQKLNPLDGKPHGESGLDDCWSARVGTEYLLLFPCTEIPLRAGVAWEQRPAVSEPDVYWSYSLGSGISLGSDPGKLILDFAYIFTHGDDVLDTLVPNQEGLKTDVEKHQVFVSAIWHL